ncbi:MAG: oligogalacturonate lyase family protein, partial [Prolixibacteraceae bacterium]
MKTNFLLPIFILLLAVACQTKKLPVLETGSVSPMPDEWIDQDTHHKIVRLTSKMEGNSLSFYFHNNPFIGNDMVFYNSSKQDPNEVTDMKKEETYNTNIKNKQLYSINLDSKNIKQLTFSSSPMNGEIVSEKTKTIFFQIKDSIFSLQHETNEIKLVYVFPEDFKASITTVNADGTLLAGSRATEEEKEILKNNPKKSDFFNLIYEAKLPKTLFTINVQTAELNKLFTDSAWLNHVQFSSVNPDLLMFCHEGPWHKVDRVWTIDVNTK